MNNSSANPLSECSFGLLGATVLFHATLQALTVGLSLSPIGVTTPVALGIWGVAASLALVFWKYWRQAESPVAEESDSRSPRFVVIFAALGYVILLLAATGQYDVSFDGNFYHLPTVHFWLHQGRVGWIEGSEDQVRLMNGFPKGVELVAFLLVRATNAPQLSNAANLLFLPLGVFGIQCLARLLGAAKSWAATAGAIWLLIPVCVLQSATTYVDSAYASCLVALAALAAVVVTDLKFSGGCCHRFPLLAFGAAAGLTLGAKPTGLAAVGLGFLAVTTYWLYQCWSDSGDRRRLFRRGIGLLCFSVFICVLVGGYWHLRNYYYRGSPLYPCGLTIAGRQIFPGLQVSHIVTADLGAPPYLTGLPAYLKWFHVWRQYAGWQRWFFVPDSGIGGLGYLWFFGAIPAFAILLWRFLRRSRPFPREAFFVAVFLLGGVFLVQPANWWPRFSVFLLGFGLPCFAVVATEVWDHSRRLIAIGSVPKRFAVPRPAVLWLWGCLSVAVIEGSLCCLSVATGYQAFPYERRVLVRAVQAYTQPKWKILWPEMAGTIMEQVLTDGEPVAYALNGGHPSPNQKEVFFLGGLIYPLGQRTVVLAYDQLDAQRLEALRAAGVRYFVWDDNYALPAAFQNYRIEKTPGFYVVLLSERHEVAQTAHSASSDSSSQEQPCDQLRR